MLDHVQSDTDTTVELVLPTIYGSIHLGSFTMLPDIRIYPTKDEGGLQFPSDVEDRLGLPDGNNSTLPSESNLFFSTLANTSTSLPTEEITTSFPFESEPIGGSSLLSNPLPSNEVGQKALANIASPVIEMRGIESTPPVISSSKGTILPLGVIPPESADQLVVPASPSSSSSPSSSLKVVPQSLPLSPLFTNEADTVDFNTVAPDSFLPNTHANALDGDDVVTLPETASGARASGFNKFSFEAGRGDDTVYIRSCEFEVSGGLGNDKLMGGPANDTLKGGKGDDFLEGGEGIDVLDGGSGADTAAYQSSPAGVIVNLKTDVASNGHAEGDVLSSIEGVVGSSYDDFLTGDEGANVLTGGAGNDVLAGLAGADTLRGGLGIDTADYSDSAVGVMAALAMTTPRNGSDADGDVFHSIENIIGSDQRDALYGDFGVNVLIGGDGGDILQGREGADTLIGGSGTDVADYLSSVKDVKVDLTAMSQHGGDAEGDILISIENIWGSTRDGDILRGDDRTNFIAGMDGNDTLSGRGGNDTLVGGAGADTIDGGAGLDTASYTASGTGVTVDLDSGKGKQGYAEGDVLSGIENLQGSNHNDNLIGDEGENTLRGESGNDTLAGLGGPDILIGSFGIDTANYAASASGVTVNLATMKGKQGYAEGDVLNEMENVEGSAYNDVLIGDAKVNTLIGGDGDDNLDGGIGADTLAGGEGDHDMASYTNSSSAVTVNLTTGINSGGDARGDTLVTIEDVTGSDFNDDLTGDANANSLLGGAGNDTLKGESGDDKLFGGAGDDLLIGGDGGDSLVGGFDIDTVSYESSPARVIVDLTKTSDQSGGDAQGDNLYNIENVIGSSFNDVITGNASDNTLTGGAGDDTLLGGEGDDVFLFSTNSDTNKVHGGDDIDALFLDGVRGAPNEASSNWTLHLSSGEIKTIGSNFIDFTDDAAGTIFYNDTATAIDFSGIEKVTWPF